MSEGSLIAIGPCFVHKGLFEFDPDTVLTVLIDPQTGLPPDVDSSGRHIEPDPGAVRRSAQRPICGPCVAELDAEAKRRGLAPVSRR